MPHINKIYDHFKEANYSNLIEGRLVDGDLASIWEEKPILLRIIRLDGEGLLADYNEMPIRIKIEDKDKGRISPNLSLLWITAYLKENKEVQMVYLNARALKVFEMPIDIAYKDAFVQKQAKDFDALKWQDEISDECIFNNSKNSSYKYLCVEEFDNNDNAFLIRSPRRTLEIKNDGDKWTITKDIKSKQFPRKLSGFSAFTIYLCPQIRIVEKTKAREAFRLTKQRLTEGTALMSLWAKYTEFEVKKAQQFQLTFGVIRFIFIKHLPNKLTRVQFNLTPEQRDSINTEREALANMALELQSISAAEFGGTRRVFKIYRFLQDSMVDIMDEDFEIKKDGSFQISTIGDEAIKKRRDNAYKQLINPSNEVIRDLLFAIEGQDAMSKAVKHHQALTERTRSFLKKNFGITDLNDNQKKAIEIALNTPDLAVIQGPPGTGKSTVVAAICDRIQEIAERESDEDTDRLILVSAFQNDTVEHISSKIKTMGLPTIKVGKGTMSLPAEMEFINQTKAFIQRQLESMPDSIHHRTSQSLKDILEVLQHEHQTINVISLIEAILPNLDAQLQQEWNAHFSKDSSLGTSKLEMRLNALITTPDKFFTDGGNTAIRRLLMCEDFHPSEEERDWLDMETPRHPEDTPDGFFDRLTAFRDKYLEPFKAITETTDDDEMFVEAWLNHAIEVSQDMEKSLFANKDNYKASILNEILQELSSSSKYIRRSIQEYSESIAATNQVAGGREMMLYPQVQNVVLEEAARSNPLDLLIPMVKATRRIIMVGDHKQLPHLLEDDIAEDIVQSETNIERKTEVKETLKESLFGRIFNNIKDYSPKRVITLNKQFRMHPFIGDFISRVYYDGVLESQEGLEDSKVHGLSLPWAKDKVAVFANVSSAEYGLEKNGKSKSRKVEATKVILLVKEILTDPASKDLSIGVITFYASQVTAICEEAIKAGYMERGNTGEYRINSQYQFTDDGREKLRIGSVDSFQGKEFDVVILSTVRSNKHDHMDMQKAYGFLSLANRLNVAFSRAQKLLIVVGNGDMFNDEGAKENVEGLYEFYTNLSTNVKYGNRI